MRTVVVDPAQLPLMLEGIDYESPPDHQTFFANALRIIGFITIVIGGLIIMLGPDSLYVSYDGPTLKEFFLLYPGPIATFGFALTAVATAWTNSLLTRRCQESTAFLLGRVTFVEQANTPVNTERLAVAYLGEGKWAVEVQPANDKQSS